MTDSGRGSLARSVIGGRLLRVRDIGFTVSADLVECGYAERVTASTIRLTPQGRRIVLESLKTQGVADHRYAVRRRIT